MCRFGCAAPVAEDESPLNKGDNPHEVHPVMLCEVAEDESPLNKGD